MTNELDAINHPPPPPLPTPMFQFKCQQPYQNANNHQGPSPNERGPQKDEGQMPMSAEKVEPEKGEEGEELLKMDNGMEEGEEEKEGQMMIIVERRKKKPYKELTLEEKVQLIRLAERCTNLSQANIAEKYEIAKSNVCRILQRKEEYIQALESAGFSGNRKRKLRTAGGEEESQERDKDKEKQHQRRTIPQHQQGAQEGKASEIGGTETGEGD
jgi:hypothetical protein